MGSLITLRWFGLHLSLKIVSNGMSIRFLNVTWQKFKWVFFPTDLHTLENNSTKFRSTGKPYNHAK